MLLNRTSPKRKRIAHQDDSDYMHFFMVLVLLRSLLILSCLATAQIESCRNHPYSLG